MRAPQLDELVGAYPNYNEEEEERRYYRRKRLGVLKNVLAASAGGMLTYGVYLGRRPRGSRAEPAASRAHPRLPLPARVREGETQGASWPPFLFHFPKCRPAAAAVTPPHGGGVPGQRSRFPARAFVGGRAGLDWAPRAGVRPSGCGALPLCGCGCGRGSGFTWPALPRTVRTLGPVRAALSVLLHGHWHRGLLWRGWCVAARVQQSPSCLLPIPGLLQMQLILHYDETYREVKYGNMGLPDIDSKMLMGINVTPIAALLYTPVLIRCEAAAMRKGCEGCWPMVFWGPGPGYRPCLPGGLREKERTWVWGRKLEIRPRAHFDRTESHSCAFAQIASHGIALGRPSWPGATVSDLWDQSWGISGETLISPQDPGTKPGLISCG